MDDNQSRSPLTNSPRRHPGQSVDQELERLINEEALSYYIAAFFAVVIAAYEWSCWYFNIPPQPKIWTLIAFVAIIYAIVKIVSIRRAARFLRLGRDGERAVGQFLEDEFRERGYRVFHDIPGNRSNIDHVLIGPRGAFIVETKTISKPARGEAKIKFDGEHVLIGSFKPDRDPVMQARAQANWLRNFVQESAGRKVTVQTVVVYPGWYIDGPAKGVKSDVWVLNPRALSAFIDHRRGSMSPEDVKLLSFHLSRYVRAENV